MNLFRGSGIGVDMFADKADMVSSSSSESSSIGVFASSVTVCSS